MNNKNNIDGEVINDSFSTCAPHVNASMARILKYDDEFRGNVIMIIIILLIATSVVTLSIILFIYGHWILGTILLIPVVLARNIIFNLLYNFPLIFKRTKQFYHSGLLTPGIIIDVNPVKLLCLAEMGNGMGFECYGLKMIKIKQLPSHAGQINEEIPCVSVFQEGESYKLWGDFDPKPISWGTDDVDILKKCIEKIGREQFKILQNLIAKNLFLDENNKLILFDKELNIIDDINNLAQQDDAPEPATNAIPASQPSNPPAR